MHMHISPTSCFVEFPLIFISLYLPSTLCFFSVTTLPLFQMASSSSSPKRHLDLNLVVETSSTKVGQPTPSSPTNPQTGVESVLLDNMIAMGAANNLLTPHDERVLSNRSDHTVISDSLVLSIRSAASISNMSRRLLARTNEIQLLTNQVQDLQRKLTTSQKENKTLQNANKQLQNLVTGYSNDMQAKLDELQTSADRIHNDYERITGMIQMPPTSSHQQQD